MRRQKWYLKSFNLISIFTTLYSLMVLLRRNRLVITLSGNSFSNIHSNDSIGNSTETNEDRNVDFLLESWFGQNKQPFEDEANLISVEQRQNIRLDTIDKFCNSALYKELNYKFERDPNLVKQVTLFRKFGAFECRMAKTGTSTRGQIFFPIFHANKSSIFPNYHPSNDSAVPKLSIHRFLNRKSIPNFGFMFTRDPFDRAVSAYFNRVLPNPKHLKYYKSLNNFLSILSTGKDLNVHFRPQLSVCDPCLLKIKFLGRKETMNEDLDYIINNATEMHHVVNFHHNNQKSGHRKLKKTVYDSELFSNVSIQVVKRFLWAYRHDYIAFGYNPFSALQKFEQIKSNYRMWRKN